MTTTGPVAIIGAGTIGAAWAAFFALAGLEVRVADPSPDAQAKLDDMLASNPPCPGDGNIDGVVNAQDLNNWRTIAHDWGLSSVYDFLTPEYRDGITDTKDEAVIQANMNKTCARTYSLY